MLKQDLTNAITVIDTTTNNAKRDHFLRQNSTRTHNILYKIIRTYTSTYKTPQNLILMETIPSLNFDVQPYNDVASSFARRFGLRWGPTLVGEPHIWRDGTHILHNCRPLHVASLAAAIVRVDPHEQFALHRPPRGPYGPWREPWGSHNRPIPSSQWPPPGTIVPQAQPTSYRDAVTMPPFTPQTQIR